MYRFELIHYKADLSNVVNRYPYITTGLLDESTYDIPISTYIPSGSDYFKFNMFVHYDKPDGSKYKQVKHRYDY
jgi:hypothetical protein